MTFSFALILAELDTFTLDQADALFEAGCDDCSPSVSAGVVVLEFDREADSPRQAIDSAIRQVRELGWRIERIEPDDLVTQSEIAKRLNRSRESVRQLVHGERQDGSFPRPVAAVTSTSPLWSWLEVTRWCVARNICSPSALEMAKTIKLVNGLMGSGRRGRLSARTQSALAEQVQEKAAKYGSSRRKRS
ncbi:MAG TPA: hypothetical protein VGP72_23970 [Planctomycetota bacterium]